MSPDSNTASSYGSPPPTKRQTRLHRLFQNLLLAIPSLAQTQLAKSKVLSFLRAWQFITRAGVRGDYLEFGTWEGTSFSLSLKASSKFFRSDASDAPRFFAFDSFQGLSEPNAARDGDLLAKGEYRAPREMFERVISGAKGKREVHVVPGFFNESLKPSLYDQFQMKKAAFITIDCDLYEPTLDVLNFVTPILQTGTVIYFDDWFLFEGDMRKGEAGACGEWLKAHTEFSLVDYGNVGVMGKMFLVNKVL